MGYAHYFGRERILAEETFCEFTKDVSLIIKEVKPWFGIFSGIQIVGSGLFRAPKVDQNRIYFNSFPLFESFVVHRDFLDRAAPVLPRADGLYWDHIKTNHLAYDEVVTACLIAFKFHFPEMRLASDGETWDWVKGHNLFMQATHRKIDLEHIFSGA